MPGRKFQSATPYRYNFNGKPSDPETVGTAGGTQDYGFRIYNPSLGRFLSVDPLFESYPELTPYQFASNRPVDGIDLDGLEYHQNARPGERMENGVLTPAKDNTAFALTEQQVLAALTRKAPAPPPPKPQATIGPGGVYADKNFQMFNYNAPYVVPGYQLAEAYGEYEKTGEVSFSSLGGGLLSILPAERLLGPLGKFIGKGGKWLLNGAGKQLHCKEFAKAFMKNVAPTLEAEGAVITQKGYTSNLWSGVLYGNKPVTENGYHTIVEIVKDGKTYVVDNLNSNTEGVLKETYIETLEIIHNGKSVFGEAAYELFTTGGVK